MQGNKGSDKIISPEKYLNTPLNKLNGSVSTLQSTKTDNQKQNILFTASLLRFLDNKQFVSFHKNSAAVRYQIGIVSFN